MEVVGLGDKRVPSPSISNTGACLPAVGSQLFHGVIDSLSENTGTIKFWIRNREEVAEFSKKEVIFKNEILPDHSTLLTALRIHIPVTMMVQVCNNEQNCRYRAIVVNVESWPDDVTGVELLKGTIENLSDLAGEITFLLNNQKVKAKFHKSEVYMNCTVNGEKYSSLLALLKVGMPAVIMLEHIVGNGISNFKPKFIEVEVMDSIKVKFDQVEILKGSTSQQSLTCKNPEILPGIIKSLNNTSGIVSLFIDGTEERTVFSKESVLINEKNIMEDQSLLSVLKVGMRASVLIKRCEKQRPCEFKVLLLTVGTSSEKVDEILKEVKSSEAEEGKTEIAVHNSKHIECAVGTVIEILSSSSAKLQFEFDGIQTATFITSDLFISGKRCKVKNISECVKCGDKCSFTAVRTKNSNEYTVSCVWRGGRPSVSTIFEEFIDLVPASKELPSGKLLSGSVCKLAPPRCALVLVDQTVPVLLFVSSLRTKDGIYLKRTDWIQEHLEVGDKVTFELYSFKVFNSEFRVISYAWKGERGSAYNNIVHSSPRDNYPATPNLSFFNNSDFKGVTGIVKYHTSPITGVAECVIRGIKIKSNFTQEVFCCTKTDVWDIKEMLPVGRVIYCHGTAKLIQGKIKFNITCMWCGRKDPSSKIPIVKLKQGEQYTGIVCEKLHQSAFVAMVVYVPVLVSSESFSESTWEQLVQSIRLGSTIKLVVQKMYDRKLEFDWCAVDVLEDKVKSEQLPQLKTESNKTECGQVKELMTSLDTDAWTMDVSQMESVVHVDDFWDPVDNVEYLNSDYMLTKEIDIKQHKVSNMSNVSWVSCTSSPKAKYTTRKKLEGKVIEVSDKCGILADKACGEIVAFDSANTFLLGLPLENVDLSKIFSPGDTLSYSLSTQEEPTQVWFGLRNFEDFSRQSCEIIDYCKARSVDTATETNIRSELATYNLVMNYKDVVFESDSESDCEAVVSRSDSGHETANLMNRQDECSSPVLLLSTMVKSSPTFLSRNSEEETEHCPEFCKLNNTLVTQETSIQTSLAKQSVEEFNQEPENILCNTEALTGVQSVELPVKVSSQMEQVHVETSQTVKDDELSSVHMQSLHQAIGSCAENNTLQINYSLQDRVEKFLMKTNLPLQERQFTDEENYLLFDLVQYYLQKQSHVIRATDSNETVFVSRGTQTTSTGPVIYTKIVPRNVA
ncbi:uncharacterized protein [Anabrus simplex]|uniref:uncharacterized protein n=1 Tax=Anabrus simplex TaxID=316456 RepID=UPI0035A308B0